MLDIFTTIPDDLTGIARTTYPQINHVKEKMKNDFFKIKNYYNNTREREVDNGNMISRLIETYIPSLELELFEYFRLIDSNLEFYSKRYGIVDNCNYGRFNKDVFQDGASEIFISVRNRIDLSQYINSWKIQPPIRVIKSPDSFLDMRLPYYDIRYNTSDTIYAYEIDIRLLMMSYRMWARERMYKGQDISINKFVAMFVITGLLDSMVDLNIWNRYKNIINHNHNEEFDNKHPFYITNYEDKLDKVLKSINNDLTGKKYKLSRHLVTLPTILNKSTYNTIQVKALCYTSQSIWFLWLTKIDDLLTYLRMLGEQGIRYNTEWINTLRYSIRNIKSGLIRFPNNTPHDVIDKFREDIEELQKILTLMKL